LEIELLLNPGFFLETLISGVFLEIASNSISRISIQQMQGFRVFYLIPCILRILLSNRLFYGCSYISFSAIILQTEVFFKYLGMAILDQHFIAHDHKND